MKKTLTKFALAALAATALSTTANAAINISVNPAVSDYVSDVAAVPNSQIIWDFDSIFAPGFSYSPATAVDIGSTPNVARAPKNDPTVYGVVDPTSSPAVFSAVNGLKTFSFLVGSPDTFNRIVFKRADNSVLADLTGATGLFGSASPINGSNTAFRVSYEFGGEKVSNIEFYSDQSQSSYAFEFDRFAGVVPEPATWAMMLMGFFGLGSLVRKQRGRQAFAAA